MQLSLWPAEGDDQIDWSDIEHLIALYDRLERAYVVGRWRRSDAALARRLMVEAACRRYVNLSLAADELLWLMLRKDTR